MKNKLSLTDFIQLQFEIHKQTLWVDSQLSPLLDCIFVSNDHIYIHPLDKVHGNITVDKQSMNIIHSCLLIYLILTLTIKGCHDVNFFSTGSTGSCHYDNCQYHQWWKSWHHDYSQFPVYAHQGKKSMIYHKPSKFNVYSLRKKNLDVINFLILFF